MNKEDLRKKLEKERNKILRPLSIIGLISMVAIVGSLFVWIWVDGSLAFKVFLSGVLGFLFSGWFGKVMRDMLDKEIKKRL